MRSLRALGLILCGTAMGLSASDASAFIPPANRTLGEIARVNRTSGRNQALQFDVTMHVGEGSAVASGQLISHPSGLARLELRGFSGRVDRYLLSGGELLGAKDGLALDDPQPLLQPLFLLQPSSQATLRAALRSFNILSDTMGLAPCGEQDCFVIGDPRLAAPLDGSGPLQSDSLGLGGGQYELSAGGRSGFDSLEGPQLAVDGRTYLPRLWVDTEDLQVRRIDRADGVFTIFGPIVSFEKLMLPAWFEVHEPGAEVVRFEVDRVVQVNAPTTAFSRKWLLAPVPQPSGDAGIDSGAPRSPSAAPRP